MWSGVLNGEFTHIVRFGNRVFASQDIATTKYEQLISIGYNNVDIVLITPFAPASPGTSAIDNLAFVINKYGEQLSEVAYSDLDNTASVGKFCYDSGTHILLAVENSKYADIAAARTDLGTMRVYYYIGQV
jgi:hypothetical protein